LPSLHGASGRWRLLAVLLFVLWAATVAWLLLAG
jgi:hypothetical protein